MLWACCWQALDGPCHVQVMDEMVGFWSEGRHESEPMRVIRLMDLMGMDELPRRSDENNQKAYTDFQAHRPVWFVSHNWWDGNELEAKKRGGHAHPDFTWGPNKGMKLQLLKDGFRKMLESEQANPEGYEIKDIDVWLDFGCVDQVLLLWHPSLCVSHR